MTEYSKRLVAQTARYMNLIGSGHTYTPDGCSRCYEVKLEVEGFLDYLMTNLKQEAPRTGLKWGLVQKGTLLADGTDRVVELFRTKREAQAYYRSILREDRREYSVKELTVITLEEK